MPKFRHVIYTLVGAAALAGILSLSMRQAGAQVNSAEECSLVADMTLAAAALNRNGVGAAQRDVIMADIYALPLAGDRARWQAILARAVAFVRRDAVRSIDPAELAGSVAQACIMNRGDLGTVFGTQL